MSVRIVTYNLLLPILAEQPGNYVASRPEYLKTEYRWKLIRSQLEQEIHSYKNTIICLQEVSNTLLSTLQAFFHQMNYKFFESLYNNKHNDYRGVALAVPANLPLIYKNAVTIGEHLRLTIQSFDATFNSLSWWKIVKYSITKTFKDQSINSWEKAMSLKNVLICVGVMVHGRPLFVGTYHMPCLFRDPSIMIIHASAAKDLMFQIANGHPFVLAGDFNMQPIDSAYRAITRRGNVEDRVLPKVGNRGVTYRFNKQQVLRSAYREKNKAEPNYTNFARTGQSSNSFCGTLDYIFFAGNLTVLDVLPLPSHPTGKSYPDRTHPSDHLMLAATLQLI
ncbi:unnamed protein product [Adineta ricciae]|uniref:Endonuclease/exonuclease/phosphatase domain-containing protein n=1 Tax=Adineta ricciae TaxID=249248 RepID=A0A815KPW2_ADIRI|nr:unnamed protein product [Adineta ricciae]CAF1487937.1 unnamed protein product [Adineta ricciae]